jgi:H+/gluconate symporter-like permease
MNPGLVIFAIVLSIAVLVVLTVKVKLHPFFALTISAFVFGLTTGESAPTILEGVLQRPSAGPRRHRGRQSPSGP